MAVYIFLPPYLSSSSKMMWPSVIFNFLIFFFTLGNKCSFYGSGGGNGGGGGGGCGVDGGGVGCGRGYGGGGSGGGGIEMVAMVPVEFWWWR